MFKRALRLARGIGIAVALSVALTTAAFGDHGHAALELPECQAYINVLETADQLYLCRTTAVELDHGDPADELGSASAVLVILNGTTPIRTVTIPRVDYALGAVYFDASDTDIPVWNSSTTVLHLSQNPAFFSSPSTSTPATVPEFNLNVGLSETATEITADLPRMMLRLEIHDPSIGSLTYVLGTSITETGKPLITDAFEPLNILAIGAFGLPVSDAGGQFDNPPDPTFITDFESAGRNSGFAVSLDGIGQELGFPYPATVLIFMGLFLAFIVAVVWFTSKQFETLYLWLWPAMYVGGSIGGFPMAAVIAVAVIAAGLALANIINRMFSS